MGLNPPIRGSIEMFDVDEVKINDKGLNPPIRGSIGGRLYEVEFSAGLNPPIRGSIAVNRGHAVSPINKYQSPYKGFNRVQMND